MFQDRFKFTILNAVLVAKNGDLAALVDSEARVMLLYCTRDEAADILTAAKEFQLTGENYVWVVTQSVIENAQQVPSLFPIGMLGKFDALSKRTLFKGPLPWSLTWLATYLENFKFAPSLSFTIPYADNEGKF